MQLTTTERDLLSKYLTDLDNPFPEIYRAVCINAELRDTLCQLMNLDIPTVSQETRIPDRPNTARHAEPMPLMEQIPREQHPAEQSSRKSKQCEAADKTETALRKATLANFS